MLHFEEFTHIKSLTTQQKASPIRFSGLILPEARAFYVRLLAKSLYSVLLTPKTLETNKSQP